MGKCISTQKGYNVNQNRLALANRAIEEESKRIEFMCDRCKLNSGESALGIIYNQQIYDEQYIQSLCKKMQTPNGAVASITMEIASFQFSLIKERARAYA